MGLALLVSDVRRGATYERGAEWGNSGARGWEELHERLVSFAKRRAGLEWEEGRLLCDTLRAGVHRRLGFASFGEYVGRLFGYNGRLVKEKLRVAQGLEALPLTSDALRTGQLTWSAVRELTRVATVETERAWLDAACGLNVRQVEELVSGRMLGDLPSDPEDPKLRRHILQFEVTGETRALFLEGLAKLRRDAGEALDDDSALLLTARKLLADSDEEAADASKITGEKADAGKANAGRTSYQVLVTTCRVCGRGEQIGQGERHAIAPAIVEMSLCDAQIIDDAVEPHVGQRPTQTIPSALRTYVWRRDNGRCVVSGCRHSAHVDVHHLKPRAEGGLHERDNLACLCVAHHRAVHEGRLIIEGTPSRGLTFKHAEGTLYGGAVKADAAERNAQVFAGLRGLGFKERECRSVLDKCAATLAPSATREEMLRAALSWLAG
ncbi:MAG: hypothetical protein ACOY0T_06235 [Myxococcota bacterium]